MARARVNWNDAVRLALLTAGSLMAHAAAGGAEPTLIAAAGARPAVRLMSNEQYASAIAYIFGDQIKVPSSVPPPRRADGLARLGASTAQVPPSTLNTISASADSIAAQVVDPANRRTLIPCTPKRNDEPDDACAARFFSSVGRLMLRRPLDSGELEFSVAAARKAGAQFHDFYAGIKYSLAGMLMAPEFLYLIEQAEPDPLQPGRWRLDGSSKAMRLSLLLWNVPPDKELLRAAHSGELHTAAGLGRQADRMLASPRQLEGGIRAFFSDMLYLDAFADLVKDPVLYPAFSLRVAADAKEQVLRIVTDHLLTRQGDYRDIFTTRQIFLAQSLAPIYQIAASVPPLDWVPYELPAGDPRAGILTQVGFLSVNAHPGRSSATRRGRAIRENILCQKVPDPPPNVDFSAIESPDPKLRTARQRLGVHSQNPVCAGCHKLTDPLGLPLESFDGAGQFRAAEKGEKIDTSGKLGNKVFADAKGLGAALHDDPALTACLVKRLYEYGVGRVPTSDDKPVLTEFQERFAGAGYRFVPLLRAIATSAAFYRVSDQGGTEMTANDAIPDGRTRRNVKNVSE